MFPYFIVWGRPIATYGMMAALGGIVAALVMYLLIRKIGGNFADMMLFGGFVAMGIIIGGSLMYGITNLRFVPFLFTARSFDEFFVIVLRVFGGSVFYGGLIGGSFAGYLCTRIFKLDLRLYFGSFGVVAPLFHAFARVGCFLGGCCFGIESKFGFTVHNNSLVPAINGVNRFPVQLLEATLNLLIFAGLLIFYLRGIGRGKMFFAYTGIYSVCRFFVEFLRGDEVRGFVGCFSTSQFISVFVFGASICALILIGRKEKNIE